MTLDGPKWLGYRGIEILSGGGGVGGVVVGVEGKAYQPLSGIVPSQTKSLQQSKSFT